LTASLHKFATMPRHDPHLIAIRRHRQGWRVTFVRAGVTYDKVFADKDHGGQDSTLIAAQAWRDETMQSVPTLTRRDISQLVKPTNTSGVPGVYYRKVGYLKAGKRVYHHVWQAQTPEGVTPYRSRSFGINRYGHDKAFELAVQARQCFLAEHDELNAVFPKAVSVEARARVA
jgi:MOSC domain-containing protein YiiM